MKAVCFSFLFFYVVLCELFIGSLAILCFRLLVRPKWLEPLAPSLRSLLKLRWPLAPSFLLVLFSGPHVYKWAAESPSGPPFRHLYLSLPGFALRGLLYWALWFWLARAVLRGKAWAGGAGIVLLFFSATFASIDWILSLEEHFGSTIFGPVFFLSCLLLAFSFATLSAAPGASEKDRQDMGSVHLALICTWAYLAFMQYLVIWSGNLPHEAAWYHTRSLHGWALIPAGVALCQFFLPLFLLLQSALKRSSAVTQALAAGTLLWQVCHAFWQILPELRPRLSVSPTDMLALALLFVFFYHFTRRTHAASAA